MGPLNDAAFRRIRSLMHESVGLAFPDTKKPLIQSRLTPRLLQLDIQRFEDYVDLISGPNDAGEFQMAVDLLTTNETYFFREPAHFELMCKELARTRASSVSIWSAASSFGDEAYSLAMLLADMAAQGSIGEDWQILGTDISDRVLRSAAAGIYPEERLHEVTMDRRRRYCLRGEGPSKGLIQMHEKLRAKVRFGWLNLCRPIEDIGPFDVIFLRNVLIYFDAPTKRTVIDRVLTQLKPGGLLFTGMAEGRLLCDTAMEQLASGAFRKLGSCAVAA